MNHLAFLLGRRIERNQTTNCKGYVMSIAEELQKLQQLHHSGALNDTEYSLAKAKLLGKSPEPEPVPFSAPPPLPESVAFSPTRIEEETRQWAMFLHLSILLGYPLPVVGFVAPILIWQLKKAELPGIDVHGKNVVNWLISKCIYALVCVILFIVVIGLPMLIALGIIGILFPIIAGIKANQGEVWKYPLAIPFLK